MEPARTTTDGQPVRLVKINEVMRLTGRSRSNIYAGISAGNFPAPIKDGAVSSRWVLNEIEQWIRDRIAERDGRSAA